MVSSVNLMANRTWWGGSDIDDEIEAETRKGPWTVEEDMQLIGSISLHGEGRWSFLAGAAGLKRTGKSCRLRWVNYLRPDLKRSKITREEERLIIELHRRWGNRWSRIAQSLPGRTDNEIKNFWRTRMKGKLNVEAEKGIGGMDGDNGVHFERSTGSYCLPVTSSQIPSELDIAEPSSSFPRQNAEEITVQTITTPYLQDDIFPQVITSSEGNSENVLQAGEIHGHSQSNDDGQAGETITEHLEGSDSLFENTRLPYTFSVGSLVNLLSSEFFADSATQDCKIPPLSSYVLDSPEAFSDSESYLSCYSDVLWNMDEEDNRFIPSRQPAAAGRLY